MSIRIVVVVLLACAGAHIVHAADAPAAAKGPAAELATPLTKEGVRELVSRLSDAEVRKLLIDHLDRGAATPAAKSAAGSGMLGTMAEDANTWRTRGAEILSAIAALPASTAAVLAQLSEGVSWPLLLAMIAAIFVIGALAEWFWRRVTRTWRARYSVVRGEGFFADAFHRSIPLAIDLAGLVVFAAGALAAFQAVWQGNTARQAFLLGLLGAVLLYRAVVMVANFVLAPSRPAARLLPLPDATARTFTRYAGVMTALLAFGMVAGHAYAAAGASASTLDALALIVLAIMFIATLATVWSVRAPIAALIRGAGTGGTLKLLADLWPIAATAYILVIAVARIREIVMGERSATAGDGILSLLLLVALPVVDYALCRALAAAAATSKDRGAGGKPGFVASYEPVLRRVIHIIVAASGFLWLAGLWHIDLFAMAQQSLGGRVASSLVGIVLVLLLAYLAWEIARTAIDRRLAAEGGDGVDHPASRLRTLLPLLRVTLMITIGTMAVLSVLAALGVNIVPLLAGAGVVGVAIGFGSQALVRDVVSGAFFLMDDAFRLGEYIEVGQAKGRIEKITVRALFLRHHRGALNILPYGEIKQLRNTSRDWIVMILEFRLEHGTDLEKVRKLVKKVGEEIAKDPELGPEMLQPLKSQGVMSTDDSALIVRAKYMARPGDAPFMIRRKAYEKILKAFDEQGIRFASRRVAVYAPPGTGDEERKRIGAAAVAQELAAEEANRRA